MGDLEEELKLAWRDRGRGINNQDRHSRSVVADLGSEVVMDLSLGKLVCNL